MRVVKLKPELLDPSLTQAMSGYVLPSANVCLPGSTYPSPLVERGFQDVQDNQVIR
jgi:hypothetical protein